MHYANTFCFSVRFTILFAIGYILLLFIVQQTFASMVIAPSTIIIDLDSSKGNQKNRDKRDNDDSNSIKAIISYYLEEGCQVVNDPTNITFSVLLDEMEESDYVGALSVRYCDVDNNLIVQFDRDEITAYLEKWNIIGDAIHLSVIVEGTFIVTCALDSLEEIEQEVSEVSEITVLGRRNKKKVK